MSNKIQIVNDKDELIGLKERSEVDYSVDTYRSSVLWIENSKGEVLIAQRKLTKDKDPGMWGPAVAGTNDEGETYESNIVKEAEEEIGFTGYEPQAVQKIKEESPRHHFIMIFKAKLDLPLEKFHIQEEEVEQLKWIEKADLMNDLESHPDKYVPAMKDIIEAVSNA